jgi:isopenicillin-N epimerase
MSWMIGTMANVALPPSAGATAEDARRMRASLWDDAQIEVPVFDHDGGLTLRLSAQIYNDLDDIDRLADAVLKRS